MLHPTKTAAFAAALLALAPLAAPQDKPQEAPPAPAAAPADSDQPLLPPAEGRKFQKAVKEYFDAKRSRESDLEARADIEKLIEDFEKKDRQERAFLSLVADLEAALVASMPHTDGDVKAKGRVIKDKFEAPGAGEVPYALHVPQKYSSKTLYPLIVSFPDQGEDLETHLKEFWASAPVRDQAVLAAVGMPDDVALWNQVGGRDSDGGVGRALFVIKHVTDKARIDPNRVYLAGKGRGVEAALATGRSFPDRFAAVVGRSGDAGDIQPVNFKNLPTFFTGAGEKATAFAAAAKEAGHENSQVVPDADEAAVWEWLGAQRRNPNPTSVLFKPASEAGSQCYWVELVRIADLAKTPASVDASADRATNTITLRCEHVPQVRLMLNDRLVDLSKPVRFVINGVEHETRLQRDFVRMLDTAWRSGDLGRAYTAATRVLDVPVGRPE